jgi:Dolichyl-phosphate-mannose-protein mannosyltransferase
VNVQSFIHSLEQGKMAAFFRLVLSLVAVIGLALAYLLIQFGGLSSPTGMDQAQIAREIAKGNGFSTEFIRPLQAHLLKQNQVPAGHIPDLYHAPLNPLVNAGVFYLLRGLLDHRVSGGEPVYWGDRLIAGVSVLFFVLALFVTFRVARLLFDARIAWLATGSALVADQFWQFSLSGLPQMLLLFLLSCSLWCLARATIAWAEDRNPYRWLVFLGFFLGAMALCHPITLWISAGILVFCGARFRPRPLGALVPGLICLALFSIWIIRDFQVSKTPFGISPFALLDHVVHTESGWMRQSDPDLSGVTPQIFRGRIMGNFTEQLGSFYLFLGGIAVVPFFFPALFHPFKRPETNTFKWLLLLMLLGAFTGSVLAGTNGQAIGPNQILILLGPALAIYGFAVVLVYFYRLGHELRLYRYVVYTAAFLVTALPAVFGFLTFGPHFQFPPYAPGLMQAIAKWTAPNEIVASDMPWAVAWYGDRESVWLPWTRKDFYDYHDFESLGAPVVCLYLTPVSRDGKFLSDLQQGEYKDWGTLIMGLASGINDFPLKSVIGLANNQCLLFMDRPRWSEAQR